MIKKNLFNILQNFWYSFGNNTLLVFTSAFHISLPLYYSITPKMYFLILISISVTTKHVKLKCQVFLFFPQYLFVFSRVFLSHSVFCFPFAGIFVVLLFLLEQQKHFSHFYFSPIFSPACAPTTNTSTYTVIHITQQWVRHHLWNHKFMVLQKDLFANKNCNSQASGNNRMNKK